MADILNQIDYEQHIQFDYKRTPLLQTSEYEGSSDLLESGTKNADSRPPSHLQGCMNIKTCKLHVFNMTIPKLAV